MLQRLQDDMQRILGRRSQASAHEARPSDGDEHIWVAGRAGVQPMTRKQFERWR